MALYISNGGTQKTLSALYTQKNGTMQKLAAAYTCKDCALTPIFSEGKMLHELSVGDTVSITETGGSAVYRIWEKSYRGTEAVLLMRERLISPPVAFDTSGTDSYAGSAADTYLQTTYMETLPDALRAKLIPVDLPVTRFTDDGSLALEYAQRDCFLLSVRELGGSAVGLANIPAGEGARLAYHIAYSTECGNPILPRYAYDEKGITRPWWMRSLYRADTTGVKEHACYCDDYGLFGHAAYSTAYYLRPALAVDPRYIPA